MKIGLLRLDHLGDMILTTPLAITLARAGFKVQVFCRTEFLPVWENLDGISYFGLPPPSGKVWVDILRWSQTIRQIKPEILVVFQRKWSVLLASLFSGVLKRYAVACGWLGLITLHTPVRTLLASHPRYIVDAWLDVARRVGVSESQLVKSPFIQLTEEERKRGEELWKEYFSDLGPRILIHPFHGGSSCHPKVEIYMEVASKLQNFACVLITGLPEELKKIQILENKKVKTLKSKLNLREFFAAVSFSDLVICGSTGILQIAECFKVPSVSLFCSHPYVNSIIWGSRDSRSLSIHHPEQFCLEMRPRLKGENCEMPFGPKAEEIVQAVAKVLEIEKNKIL
ncbi:MAG: hypothetical protein N2035_03345 [Chthoniobacterales bacterium]|nr:hypothetical protein [Chthoniobacterales bacterium]